MRLLICQTPKLTYVQAIELLQRETAEVKCDLVVLPEMALEHPPQCTSQGELTFENVALMMLSKFARKRQLYIVLGSVEERTVFTKVYDTCVVIDCKGEILLQYRKQSVTSPTRMGGTEPGIFETQFGFVGLLLGAEVDEEFRWAPLMGRKPCLVLNPTREPTKMDPVLARAHPELQVAAWHQGFHRLERAVELQMRRYSCPFVRVDAPLQEGGAGSSMLVEQHRSVVAPSWGPVFFMVDVTRPEELVSRRLPGWKQLTIDERIEAADYDKEVLKQEEVVRGPRYVVWTFRLPLMQVLAMKRQGAHWASATPESCSSQGGNGIEKCFFIPLTSQDGRPLYVVATKHGGLTLWDVRQKREVLACNLGAPTAVEKGKRWGTGVVLSSACLGTGAVVTAVGPWHSRSQFILASCTPAGVTLRVFDEGTPMRGAVVVRSALPWSRWPAVDAVTGAPLPPSHAEDHGSYAPWEPGEPVSGVPSIRAIYPFDTFLAIAVIEGEGNQRVPLGVLVDLEHGTCEPLDIYGAGPMVREESELVAEEPVGHRQSLDSDLMSSEKSVELPVVAGPDLLIGIQLIEQRLQERGPKPQRVLVCLYRSHRLCLLTCSDWVLHEQLLAEESITHPDDVPVSCAVAPNAHAASYQIVVCYASTIVRCWQASLTQCRLLSQSQLSAVATHVAVVEWPLQDNSSPRSVAVALPAGAPGVAGPSPRGDRARGLSLPKVPLNRGTVVSSWKAQPVGRRGASAGRPPGTASSVGRAGRQVADQPLGITSKNSGPLHNPGAKAPGLRLAPIDRRGARTEPAHAVEATVSESLSGGREEKAPTVAATSFLEPSSTAAGLVVVATDSAGAMHILHVRAGRMTRAYTCLDHSVYKDTQVDQLWCWDRSIAVQLSNGDVRHYEFLNEGEIINLVDLPIDSA